MWVTSIWDANPSTRDIVEETLVLIASLLTLIASPCFIFYCLFRWVWHDRGLSKRFKRGASESSAPQTRVRFMNMNLRLILGLHVTCTVSVILGIINGLTPSEVGPFCTVQSILMGYTDWVMFNYNGVIAMWLFIYVFFGKKIRALSKSTRNGLEIATHMFCQLSALFWVLLPLTTAPWFGMPYGPSGAWCWMRMDNLGHMWRLAALYIPLWIVMGTTVILYFCCLLFVLVSYHRLYSHEMKAIGGRSHSSKFSHQMFLVLHSRDQDQTLVRLSTEWKAYIKLILYPAVFLLVWGIPTVNRVSQQWFLDEPDFVLQLLHRLMVTQQGFFCVLIYPLNPVKLLVWMRKLLMCEFCRRKSDAKQRIVVNMSLDENELYKDFVEAMEDREMPTADQDGTTTNQY